MTRIVRYVLWQCPSVYMYYAYMYMHYCIYWIVRSVLWQCTIVYTLYTIVYTGPLQGCGIHLWEEATHWWTAWVWDVWLWSSITGKGSHSLVSIMTVGVERAVSWEQYMESGAFSYPFPALSFLDSKQVNIYRWLTEFSSRRMAHSGIEPATYHGPSWPWLSRSNYLTTLPFLDRYELL